MGTAWGSVRVELAGLTVVAVSAAMAPVACGSRTTASPTASSACSALFDALTSYAACSPPTDPHLPPRDRFLLNCTQHLAAPGAAPSVGAAEACAAAVRAATPVCGTIDPTACAVPPGTLDAGEACGAALQCASGYCVVASTSEVEGDTSFLTLGATLTQCGVCVARPAVGEACDAFVLPCNAGCMQQPVPCAAGATCQPSADASAGSDGGIDPSGTCVAAEPPPPPVGAGGSCTSGTTFCAAGLVCAGTTCATPGGAGAPCQSGAPGGSVAVCEPALVCGIDSTCVPRLAQGEVCTGSGTDLCIGSMVCDSTSTCQPPSFLTAGAACNDLYAFCATGPCSSRPGTGTGTQGTCPAVIADGQPCVTYDDSPGASPAPAAVCDDYATCAPPPASPIVCCARDGGGVLPQGADAGTAGTCVLLDPGSCK